MFISFSKFPRCFSFLGHEGTGIFHLEEVFKSITRSHLIWMCVCVCVYGGGVRRGGLAPSSGSMKIDLLKERE